MTDLSMDALANAIAALAQRLMFNEPTDTPSCREVLRGIKEDLVDGSFPWREE